MKKLCYVFMLSFVMFLSLTGTVNAIEQVDIDYTNVEVFTIKSFGAYTLSTQSQAKTRSCDNGYFHLASTHTATFNRYCVFVTTADTSTRITDESTISKSVNDDTRVNYTPNYVDMNNKTIKAKVRGASLEPSAGSLIRGQFPAHD